MFILAFIPVIVIAVTFAVRYRSMCDPVQFSYEYQAQTSCPSKDHLYTFDIRKESDNLYKCYICRTPSYRGRDTSNYMPHIWYNKTTNKRWICWTGSIKYPEQAKTLCRKWADATQVFIDTGKPLPAFVRR